MGTQLNIEDQIQAKGLTAPRVTEQDCLDKIAEVEYHTFPGSQLTICNMTLQNGFNVTGESACASPENFDLEIGRKIAYRNAVSKIWQLEGYLLKEKLYQEGLSDD